MYYYNYSDFDIHYGSLGWGGGVGRVRARRVGTVKGVAGQGWSGAGEGGGGTLIIVSKILKKYCDIMIISQIGLIFEMCEIFFLDQKK